MCVCKGDSTVRKEREQVVCVCVCVCVCVRVKEENGDDGVEKTLI